LAARKAADSKLHFYQNTADIRVAFALRALHDFRAGGSGCLLSRRIANPQKPDGRLGGGSEHGASFVRRPRGRDEW
jgi:hypothetical protein